MLKIANKNVEDGIDETVFITGKAQLPFVKDVNGEPKKTRGVFIEKGGKKVVIVQYDNESYMPEQINDHEKIHDRYDSKLVQKAKQIILSNISKAERTQVLNKLSKDYNGIIKGNEAELIEEFVANVLSGIDYDFSERFSELVVAYWKSNEVFVDNFRVSNYTESIDASGNTTVLDAIGLENEYSLSTNRTYARTRIRYSPKGIKLSGAEYKKFNSSVSAEYYYPYKTHKGLQYQSCVTDKTHIIYIYEDGGFGKYKPVARIDYVNIEVANAIIEVLRNGEYYRIAEIINSVLKTFEVRRSGYIVYNAYTKKRSSSRGDGALSQGEPKSNPGGIDASGGGFTGNKRGIKHTIISYDSNTHNTEANDDVSYFDKRKYWYPDLSKSKLDILKQEIKKDFKTSTRNVTDTAKWLFTEVDDTKVFAIYSTDDVKDSALLYESKGKQAEYERDILIDLLGDYEDAKSINGKSADVDAILSSNWLRQGDSVRNNIQSVERGCSDRDVRVLQRQSSRKPSQAFTNVVRNLFKIQFESLTDIGSQNKVRYSLSSSKNDTESITLEHNEDFEQLYNDLSGVDEPVQTQFWEDKINEFGTMPKGENPTRDIGVPKKITKEKLVSRFARTMLEAGVTPDDSISEFEKLIRLLHPHQRI